MKSALFVSLLLVGLTPDPVARLGPEHEPFLRDFRAADGRVRLVTVLSPT